MVLDRPTIRRYSSTAVLRVGCVAADVHGEVCLASFLRVLLCVSVGRGRALEHDEVVIGAFGHSRLLICSGLASLVRFGEPAARIAGGLGDGYELGNALVCSATGITGRHNLLGCSSLHLLCT